MGSKIQPNINKHHLKNQSKIYQKLIKNRTLGGLGGLRAILAPRWHQEPNENLIRRTPPCPKLGPKSTKNRSGCNPNGDHLFDTFSDWLSERFCANLAPAWLTKPLPKWGQVGSKIDPSWGVDFRAVFEVILAPFYLFIFSIWHGRISEKYAKTYGI